jgi:hydrogenase maturation protease
MSAGSRRKVLVAGIGNIFFTDDAFGVEVANRMSGMPMPEGVRVEDFGIRGVHLAYELLNGYDGLIIIDAVPMGDPPGTLAVIVPDGNGDDDETLAAEDDMAPVVDAHTMNPEVVLRSMRRLGGSVERIFVVGCQPASLQEGMGLTLAVAASIENAVEMCCELIAEIVTVEPVGKGNVT